jgi:hypothetical protein
LLAHLLAVVEAEFSLRMVHSQAAAEVPLVELAAVEDTMAVANAVIVLLLADLAAARVVLVIMAAAGAAMSAGFLDTASAITRPSPEILKLGSMHRTRTSGNRGDGFAISAHAVVHRSICTGHCARSLRLPTPP